MLMRSSNHPNTKKLYPIGGTCTPVVSSRKRQLSDSILFFKNKTPKDPKATLCPLPEVLSPATVYENSISIRQETLAEKYTAHFRKVPKKETLILSISA